MNNRYQQIVDNLMQRAPDFYLATSLTYHDRHHIRAMLVMLETHFGNRFLKRQMDILKLAISYHDAVYVPRASNFGLPSNVNEELSAVLFFNEYKDLTEPDERDLVDYDTVMDLIRATWWENHISETYKPTSFGESVLLDVDLHSMADPWEDFVETQKDIIKEQIGRKEKIIPHHLCLSSAFLSKFLRRPFIYHTNLGRELWESKARENINRLINAYPPVNLE